MVEWFGKIVKGEVILSKLGKTAYKQWLVIPNYYKEVYMDEFVIMPNHIHSIIIINHSSLKRTEHCSVPTNYIEHSSLPVININRHFGLVSKIIKSFKKIVKKDIKKQCNNFDFQWQRSFYDHIIRNDKSLQTIRKYIIDNPLKWELDEYNPLNAKY
ncbi:transposase [bacterium]|nr:transposase [bacterium]